MYMYAETFEDEDFYKLTLQMLFLSGEFKKYRNLYNKIKLKYDFVNSDEFINYLIETQKSLFKFELEKNNIFIYDIYGRYINDSLFDELTNNIYSIIDINKEYQLNIISDAFKSLGNNIENAKSIINDYKDALNNEEIPVDAKKYSYLTKPSIYDANNNKTQD